jgi:hypothetical protein
MSRHRPRKARIRAREKLSNLIGDLPISPKIVKGMMQDFEDLADRIDEKQALEDLVRAYSGE